MPIDSAVLPIKRLVPFSLNQRNDDMNEFIAVLNTVPGGSARLNGDRRTILLEHIGGVKVFTIYNGERQAVVTVTIEE